MASMQRQQVFKKDLLLCFDAFGTLFAPKAPIAEQYGEIARQHGLSGFSNSQVQDAFKKAFKEESKQRPNYGKASGMEAPEWWGNIVKKTFQPFVRDGSFPSGLIPDLLNRFSSKEGYTLFPDVLPFFEKLRKIKKDSDCDRDIWPWRKTTVGIITNSDDRVPFILESFGLRVGPRFHPSIEFGQREDSAKVDFDFVVLSYDVGEEKPHSDIFHAARKAAQTLNTDQLDEEVDMLYVGDEVEKDVLGALDAGWEAVLLEREGKHSDGDQGTYAHVRRGTEESSSAAKCTVVRNIGVIEPRLMALRQGLEPTLPLKT